ncbi:MAG: HRDC domain-containing protein [Desulfoprunum sp.]|nr:HRDC domain-containing protein [Desulfoprunum sp.]
MITTNEQLVKLVNRARKTDAVALDTEFVWERTYYPQLGLIQIALSDEDCHLIDPCALTDLAPLGDLLSDRSVIKILHDAPQDLFILNRATGVAPQNIFDTRLAAGFANLLATLSLGSLIKEVLDIDLAKTETRTDWLQRPLNERQVDYALDDVRYLRAVRVILISRIIGPTIKAWLQEELNLLNNPQSYMGPTDSTRYLKLRGAGNLNRQGLAILKELVIWRDEEAKSLNRPRGHVVPDLALLTLAQKQPLSIEALKQGGTLSGRAADRYGKALQAIVENTLQNDPATYPPLHQTPRLTPREKETLQKLTGLITLKCELQGIDPALVGNSSELKTLVKILHGKTGDIPKQLRQTEGWRKSFLEDFFHQRR